MLGPILPPERDWIDLASTVALLITSVGGLSVVFVFLLNRKGRKVDSQHTEADTVRLYQEVADSAAEKALKLETRVTELERKLYIKDRRIDELETEVDRLRRENIDLRAEMELLREENRKLTERVDQANKGNSPQ